MNYEQYLNEVEELNHHAYLYYCLDNPIISDSEYDIRYRSLVDFEKDNPSQIHPSSPTQRIGAPVTGKLAPVTHDRKMYSLDNAFNLEDLEEWTVGLGGYPLHLRLESKYDGLAISAKFKGGLLELAATRGDGFVGEDVTHNYRVVHNAPLIQTTDVGEIRGEVVMTSAAFERINTEAVKNGQKPYVNQRNAAAGIMRQLDPAVTAAAHLMFIAYEWYFDKDIRVVSELPYFYDNNHIDFTVKSLGDVKALHAQILAMQASNKELPYMTDGVVIKLMSAKQRLALGHTARSPRWAIAFKFPEEQVEATILDVEDQVGRTGLITPRADISPVFVAGVTVSSATLHNYEEVKSLGIMLGDTVLIKRAGEVIPKVVSVVFEKRDHSAVIPIAKPTRCPSCGGPVVVEDDGILLRCISGYHCQAQRLGRLIHFVSRKCMDMDGLGEERLGDLMDVGLVKYPSDLFSLHSANHSTLMRLPRMTVAGIKKLLAIIEAAKRPPLDKLINSLSIRGTSEETSKALAKHFKTLPNFLNATMTELLTVDGVGKKTAAWIMESLTNESDWMWELLGHGVSPLPAAKTHSNLEGKTFVITGTFSHDREEIKSKLELMGAKVSSNVSVKTFMVLAGENAGSKLTKAQQLGVRIGDSTLVEFIMTHDDLSMSIF